MEIFYPDIDEANRIITALMVRNATLENIAKALGAKCTLRLDGLCDLGCPGRILCDVQGLVTVQELDRQDMICPVRS